MGDLMIVAWMARAFVVQAWTAPALIKEIDLVERAAGTTPASIAPPTSLCQLRDQGRGRRLSKDAVMGEIPDTPGIHGGLRSVPNRIFTSNGRGQRRIVDAITPADQQGRDTGQSLTSPCEPKQKGVTMNS